MAWVLIHQNLDVLWWAFCRTLGDLPEFGAPNDTGQTNAKDAWDWLMRFWRPFNTLTPMVEAGYPPDNVSDLPPTTVRRGRAFNIVSGVGALAEANVLAGPPDKGGIGHYFDGLVPEIPESSMGRHTDGESPARASDV
jgi:hypothetical protein